MRIINTTVSIIFVFVSSIVTAQTTTHLVVNSGTQGNNNSFFGYQAGQNTTSNNTFNGYNAGVLNTSGSNNVFLVSGGWARKFRFE